MVQLLFVLAFLATVGTGLLAGASLDQSIKQLPARRRIGALAYGAYAGAADLGNGIVWYAALGISSALACVLVAVVGAGLHLENDFATAMWWSAGLAVAHSAATTRAAPTMFTTRKFPDDAAKLGKALDRFARWQALRAALQVANFGAALWCLLSLRFS